MSRVVVRRRLVGVAAAVAGVVGAVGGVAVATSLDGAGGAGGGRGDDEARSETAPSDAQVLWADREALHDGDVTVPLGLVDPPTSVRRIDGGWLVVAEIAADLGVYQVSVVRPDGSVTFLAETLGLGDVSDDGARYLVGTESGYEVRDLATGDVVDTVRGGRSPDQQASGAAQFVDDDTVATAWVAPTVDAVPEVLLSDLGSDVRRLLADDVLGEWGVSPDGRWFVGSLAESDLDGYPVEGCTIIRAVAGGSRDVEDCSGTVDGAPSFATDSSAVLSDPGGRTSEGPGGYRLLPLGDAPDGGLVSAPTGSVSAAVLGADRVAVVPSRAYQPTAVVLVCSTDVPCQEVGRSEGSPRDIALGR